MPYRPRGTKDAALTLLSLALMGACVVLLRPTVAVSSSRLDAAARAHPLEFLDRTGWGADTAQLRQLGQEGATRMLEAELRPDPHPALPPQVARMLAQLPVNTPLESLIPPLFAEQRAARMAKRDAADGDAGATQMRLKALHQRMNELTRQAMAQQLLLAIYAPDHLQQRLTWFWMNHFNVFRSGLIGPMMADYSQRVIAPHALGKFSDLLRATMFSPQMLIYLNNGQNGLGHINENYAREVMELHTLGVGSGYTQSDVTNLAHVLTGLGVDLRGLPVRVRPALRGLLWQEGLVVFNPARHDPEPRVVLGHTLQGAGKEEIERVITLLAENPATAHHVCFELAQYFTADHPDQAMVASMERTWRRTDGETAAVLRTMFTSPQFAESLGRPQFKDPMRYVLSAVFASFEGRIISNPQPLIGMLYQLGEPLYGRSTPDGYPICGGAWNSPGQLTSRFATAQRFGAGAPALFGEWKENRQGVAAENGGRTRSHPQPPALSSSPMFTAAEPTLTRATLQALAQADSRVPWNALWLASPEFMNR